MYVVDLYLRARRACLVEGMSIREASRVFGLHRDTVRKMLSHPVPPGNRRKRPLRSPKLEPCTGVIDRVLEDDQSLPKKHRHTVKHVFERLRGEYGFTGGYRERRRLVREMYVPLAHPPGHAQSDFGQAWAVIGGERRRVHYFVMSLPQSDGVFCKAYPAESTEAFCDGHVSAFGFFGGGPQSILYRQHEACRREDTGRGPSQAHPGVHGVTVALPVQRQVQQARPWQRQGQCRVHGGIHQAQLPGTDPDVRQLRYAQRPSGAQVSRAYGRQTQWAHRDVRRAHGARPRNAAAPARGRLRRERYSHHTGEFAVCQSPGSLGQSSPRTLVHPGRD